MIQRCLIIDTETTSLDPQDGHLIEFAAVLYSLRNGMLASTSSLIRAESNAAEKINRIPVAALAESPNLLDVAADLVLYADVIVAHNAEFDRQWLTDSRFNLPWLCTAFDFEWPHSSREVSSLVNLALDHGIGVSSAHRALTDCLLIAELFNRMPLFGLDLVAMFAHAMRPRADFVAMVSYDDREKAKAAGFKWDGVKKQWRRRMAIEDAAKLQFNTLQIAAG